MRRLIKVMRREGSGQSKARTAGLIRKEVERGLTVFLRDELLQPKERRQAFLSKDRRVAPSELKESKQATLPMLTMKDLLGAALHYEAEELRAEVLKFAEDDGGRAEWALFGRALSGSVAEALAQASHEAQASGLYGLPDSLIVAQSLEGLAKRLVSTESKALFEALAQGFRARALCWAEPDRALEVLRLRPAGTAAESYLELAALEASTLARRALLLGLSNTEWRLDLIAARALLESNQGLCNHPDKKPDTKSDPHSFSSSLWCLRIRGWLEVLSGIDDPELEGELWLLELAAEGWDREPAEKERQSWTLRRAENLGEDLAEDLGRGLASLEMLRDAYQSQANAAHFDLSYHEARSRVAGRAVTRLRQRMLEFAEDLILEFSESASAWFAAADASAMGQTGIWLDNGCAMKQSIERLNRAISLRPDCWPLLYERGQVLAQKVDNEGDDWQSAVGQAALRDLERAGEQGSTGAWKLAGHGYTGSARRSSSTEAARAFREKADHCFQRSLSFKPGDVEALTGLLAVCQDLNQLNQRLEESSQAWPEHRGSFLAQAMSRCLELDERARGEELFRLMLQEKCVRDQLK